jgi:hypothetical protein
MNFIPLEYYTLVYYNIVLVSILITLVQTSSYVGNEIACYRFNQNSTFSFALFITVYMGLRPISGYHFGDMLTYARYFEHLATGGHIYQGKDIGFSILISNCSAIMNVGTFFMLCSILYIFPAYLAFKRWFPNLAFFALLVFVGSFSFWGYGTNGIRAGVASSLFIWGLSYRKSIWAMFVLFLISVLFHKSMLLPLAAYGLTFIYNNSKVYLWVWFGSIFLSLAFGAVWENLFAAIGFGDDRLSSYLTSVENVHQFSSIGFRWDFIMYSFFAVGAGALYIFKYDFQDKLYHQIYNTYLLSNAFWILVIRSNFSNRFAYLSWFLMALVVIYPLLKRRIVRYQYSIIGLVILLYYSFTYVMYYVVEMREL